MSLSKHEGNRYLVAAERLGATMAAAGLPTGTFGILILALNWAD